MSDPSAAGADTADTIPAELAGRWEKSTDDACAATYPDELEFRTPWTYRGRMRDPGRFAQLGGGSYERRPDGRLRLQTANDALADYKLAVDGDRLTLTDAQGCAVAYRRAP